MKISHIVANLKEKNGIGTVVEHLYKGQKELGYEVQIISVSENVEYQQLPAITITTGHDFSEYINKENPNVVLFHSLWCFPFVSFAKILKGSNIPYAIMMHGADSVENRKKSFLKKTISNFIWFNTFLKGAKRIIYLSESEHVNCVSKNINPSYEIIPNGCDTEVDDIKCHLTNDLLQFVYIGRMSIHHKGIDVLLDALNLLYKQGFRKAFFSFYGYDEGPDIETIKHRIQSIGDIARFCGPANESLRNDILRISDAFVLTSRYEGMPMGVLEALSYGVPCLLTPGTNMALDVEHAGAGWSSSFNAQSIADSIIKACDDLRLSYQEFHQSALELSKNYNWNGIVKKHVLLMERIVNSNNNFKI